MDRPRGRRARQAPGVRLGRVVIRYDVALPAPGVPGKARNAAWRVRRGQPARVGGQAPAIQRPG